MFRGSARWRWPLGLTLALALACGGHETSPVAAPDPAVSGSAAKPASSARREATKRPFVVIGMVIDQFAAWVADERLPKLPEDGGFARLRREGVWVKDARFDHAVTDTAPGHASLFTGALPRNHGIFANEIIDPGTRKNVSILTDVEAETVSKKGVTQGGVSLKRLASETVADRIRAEVKDAWIASISWKDRAALFGGGRSPDIVLFHDKTRNEFVTGPTKDRPFPSVAAPLDDELAAIRASTWTPLDSAWLKAQAPTKDAQKGEGDLEGTGATFPHSFAKAQGLGVRLSPKADELLLDLAVRCLDEGKRLAKSHMFLSVSLSTNDYIGHVFGPGSWEAWDATRRLDGALAKFMTKLDERFGSDGWALVLSADHGVARLPEAVPEARGPRDQRWDLSPERIPRRVLPDALAKQLEAALEKALGPGDYVLGIADPYVYLTENTKKLDAKEWETLWRTMAIELAGTDGIARSVFLQDGEIGSALEDQPELRSLVEHSLRKDAGSIYLITRKASLIDTLYVPGKGTGHGTPYLYDRSVPLFARAPGLIDGGKTIEGPLSFATYARTLAALSGVAPPEGAERATPLTSGSNGGGR